MSGRDRATPVAATAPKELRRIVGASVVGAVAEYYDFFIYGTASALAFNKVFFPEVDPAVGTLAAFSTYAVGFFARPLGGLVWGVIGDRIGRKRALVFTLQLTGLGTFAVGLLPTYHQIGIWAAVILVLVRLIQGFGVGGEQGGAALLTAEAAPPGRRGFFASFVQLGSPAAYLIPTGLFALLTSELSDAAFLSWGWRVPFLLSSLVVIFGLVIRLRVNESATCQAAKKTQAATVSPLKLLMRDHRREVVGGLFTKFVEAAVFPFYTVFLVTYAKDQGVDTQMVLNSVLIAVGAELIAIPLLGRLTDRVGRRPVYLAAAVLNLILVVPAFLLFADESVAGTPSMSRITPGRVFWEPQMPGSNAAERAAVYDAMNDTIANLILQSRADRPRRFRQRRELCGAPGRPLVEAVSRLRNRKDRRDGRLIEWLPQHRPPFGPDPRGTGDYGHDNLIAARTPRRSSPGQLGTVDARRSARRFFLSPDGLDMPHSESAAGTASLVGHDLAALVFHQWPITSIFMSRAPGSIRAPSAGLSRL